MSESLYGHLFRSSALQSDRSGCPDLHIIRKQEFGQKSSIYDTFFLHKNQTMFYYLAQVCSLGISSFSFQFSLICFDLCKDLSEQYNMHHLHHPEVKFCLLCAVSKNSPLSFNTGEINLSYSLSSTHFGCSASELVSRKISIISASIPFQII